MAITVNIATSAQVDARLEQYRQRVNIERNAAGLDEYTSVNDMAEKGVRRLMREWANNLYEDDINRIQGAFVLASDADQQTIRNLLGI